jgi:hypothetical protein
MFSHHFVVENTSISCCFDEKNTFHQERRRQSADAHLVVPKSKFHDDHDFSKARSDILLPKMCVEKSHWTTSNEHSKLQDNPSFHKHCGQLARAGGNEERILPPKADANIDKLAFALKRRSTIAPWLARSKDVSYQSPCTSPEQDTLISRRVPLGDKQREILRLWDTGSPLTDSPSSIKTSKRLSEISLQRKTSEVRQAQRETLRWETGSTVLADCPPVLPKRSSSHSGGCSSSQ